MTTYLEEADRLWLMGVQAECEASGQQYAASVVRDICIRFNVEPERIAECDRIMAKVARSFNTPEILPYESRKSFGKTIFTSDGARARAHCADP